MEVIQMGLWIFYTDASSEHILLACEAAALEFSLRGVDPKDAQDAANDAADLEDDHLGEYTLKTDLVIAWYSAENIAMRKLHELDGGWPDQSSLIFVEEGE
jgi:hypothetical protein